MRKYHFCSLFSTFLEIYIPCNPILSLVELFFKKKLRHGSHSTLGQMRYFVRKDGDKDRINGKGNVKNKSSTIKKGLKEKIET
jgi:hypothetical protein